MPSLSPDTPRSEYTFSGAVVRVPAPYAAGHPCSEGEARALNQVIAENLRNNLSEKIKANPEKAQTLVDEYYTTYEMGAKRGGGGGRTVDPVEKEARRLATEAVRKALVKKGYKLGDIPAEQIRAQVDKALEQHPKFRQQAKRNVDALARMAEGELDLEGISPSAGTQGETAPAA